MKEGFLITTDIASVDRDNWLEFVVNNENGNVFHTPVMVDFFTSVPLYEPLVVFCIDRGGRLAGLVASYILRENRGLTGFASSRAIVWGGPLMKKGEEEICNDLLTTLKDELKGKVTYLQVRNLFDTSALSSFFKMNKFRFSDHLDLLFDLKKGDDYLWGSVHPTRRKQIRRAKKRGVETEIDMSPSKGKIADCYQILRRLYSQIKLPFPDYSFFENALEILGKSHNLGVITASFSGRIIGFRFFLLFNGQIYDWYAASLPEHYDKYPNDILPWELIQWGHENNHSLFDFGGAGNPNEKYGVRDYKMKFGGEKVNYGRYLFVFRPLIYYAGKIMFKIIRKKS